MSFSVGEYEKVDYVVMMFVMMVMSLLTIERDRIKLKNKGWRTIKGVLLAVL